MERRSRTSLRGPAVRGLALLLAGACQAKPAPPAEPAPLPLAAALVGLGSRGVLEADIATTEGTVHCTLDEVGAPLSVGMFVGLARGLAAFRDPASHATVTRPFYDGQRVFRATEDLMIQSGCPIGDGTGTPGYRIAIEPHPDDELRLSRPGALLLASYHAPPNREDPSPPPPGKVIGSQFVIALGDLHHLAGKVTVLGTCRDLPTVAAIARTVSSKQRPVTLTQVTIARRVPSP